MAIGDKVRKVLEDKAVREAIAQQEAQMDAAEAALEADTDVAPQPAPVSTAGLTFEQMLALFKAAQPAISPEQIADISANAAAKAKMPENKVPTGISVYNPTGGPRPKLKCRMYFGSYPIEAVTCTNTEIASLNAMTPGVYRVQKTDGGSAVIEVKGQINANHEIERLWILIPSEDEGKNNYGPTLSYLVDQFTDGNRVQSVAA